MQRKRLAPKSGEHLTFPIADGTVKISGRDQVLRTSTLIRDCPERGEEHGNLLGEPDGSPPQDSSLGDGEAKNDSGPCQETSYTVITLNRESNFTRAIEKPKLEEVFTSLLQQMRSSRKLSKMRGESWKFRCQQLC